MISTQKEPSSALALADCSGFSGRLKKDEWEVRPVAIDVARRLVQSYHYARGASNTATYLHGLFRRGAFWEEQCLGCAWWIPPTRSAAEATYPTNWQGVLSLSRLVVAPDVPKNACTFLLARSTRLIDAKTWPCLVTYADQWRGHTGGIYRAANWKYVGLTGAEATFTINGVMTARKAGGKTRTQAEMMALGARNEGRHAKHKYVLLRLCPNHERSAMTRSPSTSADSTETCAALAVPTGSAFLANLHHMCAQTDGTYRFPNSREGDMLKTAKREIEQLRSALSRVRQQTKDYDRYSLPGVLHRIASEGLSPNSDSAKSSR